MSFLFIQNILCGLEKPNNISKYSSIFPLCLSESQVCQKEGAGQWFPNNCLQRGPHSLEIRTEVPPIECIHTKGTWLHMAAYNKDIQDQKSVRLCFLTDWADPADSDLPQRFLVYACKSLSPNSFLSRTVLCHVGFYSIPSLYLLDATITSPTLVVTIKNVDRCAKCSFGTKLLPVRTMYLKEGF